MLPSQSPAIFTVSRLNQTVRLLLEYEMGQVWISGEISNLHNQPPVTGTLRLKTIPRRCAVRCSATATAGSPSTHSTGNRFSSRQYYTLRARGDYQIIVESMQPAGEGLLQQKYEQLKAKLQAEGLFDLAIQKITPLPCALRWCDHLKTGAALHDILHVLTSRSFSAGDHLPHRRTGG